MPKSVIISSHAFFASGIEVYGPAHSVSDFLRSKGVEQLFIRHPLEGAVGTNVFESRINGERQYLISFPAPAPRLARSLIEVLITILLVVRLRKRFDVYVGVNPLNAVVGLILKHLRLVKVFIYYSVDFTHRRFESQLLNSLYHAIDLIGTKSCDFVWNVSSRIYKVRRSQGVSSYKNLYVPNSTYLKRVKPLPKSDIQRRSIVLVANLTESLDFRVIVDAIQRVSKVMPDVKLCVVGRGPLEKSFRKMIDEKNFNGTVMFVGYMSHENLMNFIPRFAIGLALYSDKSSWTWFGDSMKVREYLASGCPVIMNDLPSTADDIRNAGAGIVLSTRPNCGELAHAIIKMLTDENYYDACRQKALEYAERNDMEKLLENAFSKCLRDLGYFGTT